MLLSFLAVVKPVFYNWLFDVPVRPDIGASVNVGGPTVVEFLVW
jgi:hypothetical protein